MNGPSVVEGVDLYCRGTGFCVNLPREVSNFLQSLSLDQTRLLLKYKAQRRGIAITQADRFFASSKTCSHCGHKKDNLTLSDRQYHCDAGGVDIDRDLNAAINLCPA